MRSPLTGMYYISMESIKFASCGNSSDLCPACVHSKCQFSEAETVRRSNSPGICQTVVPPSFVILFILYRVSFCLSEYNSASCIGYIYIYKTPMDHSKMFPPAAPFWYFYTVTMIYNYYDVFLFSGRLA